MVAIGDARFGVHVTGGSGKNVLPAPFPVRVGMVACERIRKANASEPVAQVTPVLFSDIFQVRPQKAFGNIRQHGHAVFLPLAIADQDLVTCKIHVFDPQSQAFQQAKPAAVKQRAAQKVNTLQKIEKNLNLFTCENDWQPFGLLGPCDAFDPIEREFQDMPVEEEERAERLVLS